MTAAEKYNDNVVGSGARYKEAYFEIKYLRTYTTTGAVPAATSAQGSGRYVSSAIPMSSGRIPIWGAWVLFVVVFGARWRKW